jgi:hypothetical protein
MYICSTHRYARPAFTVESRHIGLLARPAACRAAAYAGIWVVGWLPGCVYPDIEAASATVVRQERRTIKMEKRAATVLADGQIKISHQESKFCAGGRSNRDPTTRIKVLGTQLKIKNRSSVAPAPSRPIRTAVQPVLRSSALPVFRLVLRSRASADLPRRCRFGPSPPLLAPPIWPAASAASSSVAALMHERTTGAADLARCCLQHRIRGCAKRAEGGPGARSPREDRIASAEARHIWLAKVGRIPSWTVRIDFEETVGSHFYSSFANFS